MAAYLESLKAGAFSAKLLRPLVLSMIKDAIAEPFVTARDDALVVDVQDLVRRQKSPVPVSFEVKNVSCIEGGVVVEAGLPEKKTKPSV